jgi:tetratricopeptide (TPR) repeat protein
MTSSSDVTNDLRRAEALIGVNRPADAQTILSGVLATSPDNVRAYCLIAQCANATNNYVGMLRAATQATTYGPSLEWGHRLRSTALRCLGRETEAVQAARTAVELAPNSWPGYVALTEALLPSPDRDRRRGAYEAAGRAVTLAPQIATTHVTMGRVLLSIGERQAAQACFERAIGLNPTDPTAHINLAVVDLRRGRVARAARGLGGVAAANPAVATYANNVKVAAAHWYQRVLDVGALACFAQVVLVALVRPATAGATIGLALSAAYVLAAGVLFVRLPRPMRTLVIGRAGDRANLWATIALVVVFGVITFGSIQSLRSDEDAPILHNGTVVIWLGFLLLRFRYRLLRSLRWLRLRRTYRAYVLGESGPPVIPRQASPTRRPSPTAQTSPMAQPDPPPRPER